MKLVELDHIDAADRLERSIDSLLRVYPELSASPTKNPARRRLMFAVAALVVALLVVATIPMLVAIMGVISFVYLAAVMYRVLLFYVSLHKSNIITISDEDARAIPDSELPVYTVLIPAFREPEVVRELLHSIDAMEYPRDRLDVQLLLEMDDEETIAAALSVEALDYINVVLVPPSEPRTKPKALNYGLGLAVGQFVTIYDVEDLPDPLQLRRAVAAFRDAAPEVACFQARLSYHNTSQNLITKWFTTEYGMWFALFLPGLSALGAPIPLGGTSNHFRREVLEALGSWDPHNVTEDADLGIRLAREGWTVKVLDSVTYEEANCDFVNWVKQRSRWYKGYLQTWLVHMRDPRRTQRQLGWKAFAQFNLFVGGTPILALLNPIFWALTILWFVGQPSLIRDIFPGPVYYMGATCWAIGNFTIAYLTVVSVRYSRQPELIFAALAVPIYWMMMSIAAVKAAIQLVTAPSYWEKTTHGLSSSSSASPSAS